MDADPPRQRRTRRLVGSASVRKVRNFLIELRRGRGHRCSADVDVSVRMTVDEDKQLYRGPPRERRTDGNAAIRATHPKR